MARAPRAPVGPTSAQQHAPAIAPAAPLPPAAPVAAAPAAPVAPPAPETETVEEVLAKIDAVETEALAAIDPNSPHPDHPLLTYGEVAEVRAKARAEILAKQKASAKASLLKSETARLAAEEGLITGSSIKDEVVNITLDLAEHSDKLVINFQPYYHGFTYTVPRHVADSLAEMQMRGWRHQDEIDGKDLTQHYQRARHTILSPVKGNSNVPQRFDA